MLVWTSLIKMAKKWSGEAHDLVESTQIIIIGDYKCCTRCVMLVRTQR